MKTDEEYKVKLTPRQIKMIVSTRQRYLDSGGCEDKLYAVVEPYSVKMWGDEVTDNDIKEDENGMA